MKLYASIISGDLGNIREQVKLLKKAGIDGLHFDVMDGVLVPRFGLPPEILKVIKDTTDLPVNVHIMVDNPKEYLDTFIADSINYHLGNVIHGDKFELVMGVQPGTIGQPIRENTYEEIVNLKKKTTLPIMVDGGVSLKTAPKLKEAGADVLVVGKAIYTGNLALNIRRLHAI
jgi:ribulose-phosphate 3-epimerase